MEEKTNKRNNLIRKRIKLIVVGRNLNQVPVNLLISTISTNNMIVIRKVPIKKSRTCNKLVIREI